MGKSGHRVNFLKLNRKQTEGEFYSLMNEHTGFLFGPLNCPEERNEFFETVQNPKKYFKNKSTKERIQAHEKMITQNLGDIFLNFHETMFDENCTYVAYYNNKSTFYIPNYLYDDTIADFAWKHMFMSWALKEALIAKTDREPIIEMIDYFLPDIEMGTNFKKHVNHIFDEIDYSKINPIVIEDFTTTSKIVGRKINWE